MVELCPKSRKRASSALEQMSDKAEGNIAMSENQHQNQTRFTTEDTETTHPNEPKPGSLGTLGTERRMLPEQQAEVLALKLAQTYEELTRLLERNPGVKQQITEGTAREDKVYQKLKQRLKMADMAPRCQWVRQDGTSCRSPQMKNHIYCFAHMQMAEARELMLRLPPPEDANAIQVGIMRIQKSLIEGTISTKIAGLLLYSMQLALTNVGQTTFGKAKDEEMVRETVDEDEAFREKQTPTTETRRHGEEKNLPLMNADARGFKNQTPFTAEGAEDAEKEKNLPLMNAENTDLEKGRDFGPESEFVPVPGGYGFERVRLRIGPKSRQPETARAKNSAAELGVERKPAHAVIAPERDSETYAVVG